MFFLFWLSQNISHIRQRKKYFGSISIQIISRFSKVLILLIYSRICKKNDCFFCRFSCLYGIKLSKSWQENCLKKDNEIYSVQCWKTLWQHARTCFTCRQNRLVILWKKSLLRCILKRISEHSYSLDEQVFDVDVSV